MEIDLIKFLKNLKLSGGHYIDRCLTTNGDTMIYYRKYGSFTTDVKTIVFNKKQV